MLTHTPGEPGSGTPHQGRPLLWGGCPLRDAARVLVLVHGRGGSSEDILGLGEHLAAPDAALVAPGAFQHTWYPHRFLEPTAHNEPWLSSALRLLDDLEAYLVDEGIPLEHIFLVGFSQGACLSSESVRRRPRPLAGLLAYAGGVIGPEAGVPGPAESLSAVPVLLACGDADPHIPASRVRETADLFARMGAAVDLRLYPGMGHGINPDGLAAGRRILAPEG